MENSFILVSHLAGSVSLSTHIILDRQLISEKVGGLTSLHLSSDGYHFFNLNTVHHT